MSPRSLPLDQHPFGALGLSAATVAALDAKGFEQPSPVQAQVIPLLLQNNTDIIAQAATGTGKTAAFGLPLIELCQPKQGHVQAIVLTPTRELAIQVVEELASYSGRKPLRILPVYGGAGMHTQLRALQSGVDIVVGTPGRVIDHLSRGSLNIGKVTHLVLDEADRMLDMGFVRDVERIMSYLPRQRRMLLFSATMPKEILHLAKQYMPNYATVTIPREEFTGASIDQIYLEVRMSDKFEALCRILDTEKDLYGVVFCRTKREADRIAKQLHVRGYATDALHGDVVQSKRERILKAFRDRRITLLIATDVAARGIDVNDLTHVINYSLPQDTESYVHRIGRTGRAGRSGTAITFVLPDEYRELQAISKHTGNAIRQGDIAALFNAPSARPAAARGAAPAAAGIPDEVRAMLLRNAPDALQGIAKQVLQLGDAQRIVASLLLHIAETAAGTAPAAVATPAVGGGDSTSVDATGITRLFVGKGKKQGMTAQALAENIVRVAGVPVEHIRQIDVRATYALVEVPFADAERILHAFEADAAGGRPLIREDKK